MQSTSSMQYTHTHLHYADIYKRIFLKTKEILSFGTTLSAHHNKSDFSFLCETDSGLLVQREFFRVCKVNKHKIICNLNYT